MTDKNDKNDNLPANTNKKGILPSATKSIAKGLKTVEIQSRTAAEAIDKVRERLAKSPNPNSDTDSAPDSEVIIDPVALSEELEDCNKRGNALKEACSALYEATRKGPLEVALDTREGRSDQLIVRAKKRGNNFVIEPVTPRNSLHHWSALEAGRVKVLKISGKSPVTSEDEDGEDEDGEAIFLDVEEPQVDIEDDDVLSVGCVNAVIQDTMMQFSMVDLLEESLNNRESPRHDRGLTRSDRRLVCEQLAAHAKNLFMNKYPTPCGGGHTGQTITVKKLRESLSLNSCPQVRIDVDFINAEVEDGTGKTTEVKMPQGIAAGFSVIGKTLAKHGHRAKRAKVDTVKPRRDKKETEYPIHDVIAIMRVTGLDGSLAGSALKKAKGDVEEALHVLLPVVEAARAAASATGLGLLTN